MKLYEVRANCVLGRYMERVRVYDVQEKEKSYIGECKRFNKSKINIIQEGSFYGSYNMFLIDEGKIQDARVALKEKITSYLKSQYDKAKLDLESSIQHSLDSEISIEEW